MTKFEKVECHFCDMIELRRTNEKHLIDNAGELFDEFECDYCNHYETGPICDTLEVEDA